MAERDEAAPHGLRLRIEDYPNDADGLWCGIASRHGSRTTSLSTTLTPFSKILSSKHGRMKLSRKVTGTRKMQNGSKVQNSMKLSPYIDHTHLDCLKTSHSCEFRQYNYSDLVPNQPCLARKLVPEPHDPQFQRLIKNPHKFMLETLPSQEQVTVVMLMVESLSTHSTDEEYLGYNDNHTNWTSDERVVKAFQAFSKQLAEVDKKIIERIKDLNKKH